VDSSSQLIVSVQALLALARWKAARDGATHVRERSVMVRPAFGSTGTLDGADRTSGGAETVLSGEGDRS
jgi:hypothetical protein